MFNRRQGKKRMGALTSMPISISLDRLKSKESIDLTFLHFAERREEKEEVIG